MSILDDCGLLARQLPLLEVHRQVRDLAAMLGPEAGDQLEFDHLGDGALRLGAPDSVVYGPAGIRTQVLGSEGRKDSPLPYEPGSPYRETGHIDVDDFNAGNEVPCQTWTAEGTDRV